MQISVHLIGIEFDTLRAVLNGFLWVTFFASQIEPAYATELLETGATVVFTKLAFEVLVVGKLFEYVQVVTSSLLMTFCLLGFVLLPCLPKLLLSEADKLILSKGFLLFDIF